MLTVEIRDAAGNVVGSEEVDEFAQVSIVLLKRGPDGKFVVDSFEPPEVDGHNDTLRYIGGRVVDFVEKP
jgi:hypothetical protein